MFLVLTTHDFSINVAEEFSGCIRLVFNVLVKFYDQLVIKTQ